MFVLVLAGVGLGGGLAGVFVLVLAGVGLGGGLAGVFVLVLAGVGFGGVLPWWTTGEGRGGGLLRLGWGDTGDGPDGVLASVMVAGRGIVREGGRLVLIPVQWSARWRVGRNCLGAAAVMDFWLACSQLVDTQRLGLARPECWLAYRRR